MDALASTHAIVICARCRVSGSQRSAGDEPLALLSAGRAGEGFSLETADCMAGCDRPLAVAFRAAGKATYLFGGIDPASDAGALVAFGRLHRALPEGWCSERERPAGHRGKTLARIPAHIPAQGRPS